MSDHRLNIDVQKMAIALQAARAQLDVVESIIQEALVEENEEKGEGE